MSSSETVSIRKSDPGDVGASYGAAGHPGCSIPQPLHEPAATCDLEADPESLDKVHYDWVRGTSDASCCLSKRPSTTYLEWRNLDAQVTPGPRPPLTVSNTASTDTPMEKIGSRRSVQNRDKGNIDELMPGERLILFGVNDVVVVPHQVNAMRNGQPNKVTTAKFTFLTWLPISLYEQFRRVANIYFLCIAVIVCFPWSPKRKESKVIPFAGVLLWTALKDLYEDSRRMRDDKAENAKQSRRFDPEKKAFVPVPWQDLFVGDVLYIPAGEAFPADLLLLHAQGGEGAYISTVSLDGESNLKEKQPPAPLASMKAAPDETCPEKTYSAEDEAMQFLYEVHVHELKVKLGRPETTVWDVKGTISANDLAGESYPMSERCFLPRGCVLRNTEWILGVVAYVGADTKVRLNAAKVGAKFSQMQKSLNTCVWGLLTCLLVVCLYSATLAVITAGNDSGFCCDEDGWLIMFLKFCIMYYHVVPLSLYVCFEMLKLILGFAINKDELMQDPDTGDKALARTADLVEEMGQVDFIFSDKTGTLTANEMVFAGCSIAGQDYGDFRKASSADAKAGYGVDVSGHDESHGTAARSPCASAPAAVKKVVEMMQKPEGSQSAHVKWFFTCLATCHAVKVEREDAKDASKTHVYSGMSPDEVALVQGAFDVGVVYDRTELADGVKRLIVTGPGVEERRTFECLYELEFNSDRKRMSVLVRNEGNIVCITKGADNVMEQLLAERLSDQYRAQLDSFSQRGLRTLVVAWKEVAPDEFKSWERKFNAAQSIMDSTRDAKVFQLAAEMEQKLTMAGVTAVEDRLQDGVPQVIQALKDAGIRIWVLTGDKTETAVDIARSCNLFATTTKLAYATGATSQTDALRKLRSAESALHDVDDAGLVLDGKTLYEALQNEICRDVIYNLGLASRSCVCTRLSPKQKRDLVSLVREHSPSTVTLSIGDGANDVPMLEGAHVGIGIRGKEGAQAVQVADVAISQFRFLLPLLFCHGRRAYRRVALFLCFYLYKNVSLAIGDVVWMHQNSYKGEIAFPEYLSVNHNVLFTSWHVLFVIGFDEAVNDDIALQHPELYMVGPRRMLFNLRVFAKWMAYGLLHGIGAWLIPNLWFGDSNYNPVEPGVFWLSSCTSFSLVVIVAMLKLLLAVENPLTATALLSTLAAFFCLVFVALVLGHTSLGTLMQPNMEGIPAEMLTTREPLVTLLVAPFGLLSVDVAEKVLSRILCPTSLQLVRARRRQDCKTGTSV